MKTMKCLLAAALALLMVALPGYGEDISAEMFEAVVSETAFDLEGPAEEDVLAEASAADEQPNVESFALTADALTLGVGESRRLFEGDAVPAFKSSNAKVAKVSADGAVKAVKRGSATITAMLGDVVQTCAVKVVKAPSSVTVSEKSIVLGYDAALGTGETGRIVATLSKGSASALNYGNYDASIVRVDENGYVTAVGVGNTGITVGTFNGRTAKVSVSVLSAPAYVELESEALSIGKGASFKLGCRLPENTTSRVSYVSDHPECVCVDEQGTLLALSEGSARVEARCFNGVSSYCDITVTPAPTVLLNLPTSLEMGVGETIVLAPTSDIGDLNSYSFATSKKKYVSVSASGAIKAVKKGKATVRVSAYNGVSADIKVTVKAAPKSVSLAPKALALEVGSSAGLKASLPAKSSGGVFFTSEDPEVCTMDGAGTVTAIRPGRTRVIASTYNGRHAYCDVEVYGQAAEIRVPASLELVTSLYTDLPIEVMDGQGNAWPGQCAVSIEPEGVAAYEEGRLLGIKPGNARVTVSAGEVSRVCELTVVSYKSVHGIQSIAHRGGCGYWPENTLEAFRNASTKGAEGVELDARSTKDGVQVIHHDATFKVSGKTYTVKKLTWAQIKKLKPSVCTLDQALEVLGETDLWIHLELKNTADGKKCVKAIADHGLKDRTVYFSFYEAQLKQVRSADASAKLGLSLDKDTVPTSNALFDKAKRLHISFFVAHKSLMNQEVTDLWHRLGYEICVWTPNTREEVRALCDLGVDYILSDYPDYCVAYR